MVFFLTSTSVVQSLFLLTSRACVLLLLLAFSCPVSCDPHNPDVRRISFQVFICFNVMWKLHKTNIRQDQWHGEAQDRSWTSEHTLLWWCRKMMVPDGCFVPVDLWSYTCRNANVQRYFEELRCFHNRFNRWCLYTAAVCNAPGLVLWVYSIYTHIYIENISMLIIWVRQRQPTKNLTRSHNLNRLTETDTLSSNYIYTHCN